MPKILIIDDEATIRYLLSAILTQEGYEVLSGESGEIGLELARDMQPDLIICDINMPSMNGYSVLTQLRQNVATARIPFIFLSGKLDEARSEESEFQANAYISKPFKRADMLKTVAEQLTNL